MTRENAVALANSEWWKDTPNDAIVSFQLFEDRLCMPFGDFQAAVEKALGRGVWTHEFAKLENLRAEFLGERPKPTMQEIIEQIPAEKRILFVVPEETP